MASRYLALIGLLVVAASAYGKPPIEISADSPQVIWVADIGSQAGPMAVNDDRILIATNNDHPRDRTQADDAGVMMCFARDSGKFLWQMTHPRLENRRNDIGGSPIQSRPCLDSDRAYYVSNRGELTCVQLAANAQVRLNWKVDFVNDLGVFKRDSFDIANPVSSPIVVGDNVFCLTGHGRNDKFKTADPAPPSLVAVNKQTGRVLWSSNAPSAGVLYAQWSSPIAIKRGADDLIVFPAGDGFIYGCEALTGKIAWKFDGNAMAKIQAPTGVDGRGFYFPPLLNEGGMLYGAINQGVESWYDYRFPVFALNLPTADSKPPTAKWTFLRDENRFGTLGPLAADEHRLYFISDTGILYAVDKSSGEQVARTDLLEAPSYFGGPVIADGLLYVPTESAVHVFRCGAKIEPVDSYRFHSIVAGTPVIKAGCLLVATSDQLWALRLPK